MKHIIEMSIPSQQCEVGQIFNKVKVAKLLYGGSYQMRLPDPQANQLAFLHKSHLPGSQASQAEHEESSEDDDADKKKKKQKKLIDELQQN